MAKAKVVHSEDSCMIIFKGDKRNPEPGTGVIKFPGGHVEVSRTTDGEYWAHLYVDTPANIVDSRVDYDYEGYIKKGGKIDPIPHQEHIVKMAIRVNGPYISSETL